MANPQPAEAHLRIAHTILEQIMVSDFTKRQLSLLLFILRLSWGCGKEEAIVPLQNDFEMVGVGKGHIKAELDWLIEAKVITRDGDRYSFNKGYDQWRVSRARAYTKAKVTKMVTLNLAGNHLNGNYGGGSVEEIPDDRQVPGEIKEILAELRKLPGWKSDLAYDVKWLSEFMAEFREAPIQLTISYIRGCRDYHLKRSRVRHTAGDWRNRLRNWMEFAIKKECERNAKSGKTQHNRSLPDSYTPQRDYSDA